MTGLERENQALREEIEMLNSHILTINELWRRDVNQNRELKLIIQREKPQPSNKAWFLLGE